jgi:putative FmdB family regulatory protein
MPTYEYACRACGEHLEVVQSFRDDALSECPACHGQLRKVFSAAGIIFKGSGWHVKDYASSTRAASGSTGSPDASSGGGDAQGRSTSGSGSGESSTSGDSSDRPASASSSKAGKASTSDTSTSSSQRAASA